MKLKIRSMAAAGDCDLPVWRLRRKKSSRRKGPRGGEGSGHATVQRLGQRQGFAQAERRQTKSRPRRGQQRNQVDRATPSRDSFAMQKSLIPVIPSLARDLVVSATYEGEIPRRRLGMTVTAQSLTGKSEA